MITKEKYNFWNTLKQKIHFGKNKEKYPKAGEIWNIYNGLNIGYESKGKGNKFERPFLVIKKIGIMFLCISMTTKGKNNNKFYFKLNNKYFDKNSYITLSQGRCIDNRRFIKKIGKISCSDLYKIKKDLKSLWF